MQIVKFYNGLDWFIEAENMPGSTKIYRAKVAKVGEQPLLKVVVAVRDPDNPEVDEDDVDEATMEYLYRKFIDDTMDIIGRAKQKGILDHLLS